MANWDASGCWHLGRSLGAPLFPLSPAVVSWSGRLIILLWINSWISASFTPCFRTSRWRQFSPSLLVFENPMIPLFGTFVPSGLFTVKSAYHVALNWINRNSLSAAGLRLVLAYQNYRNAFGMPMSPLRSRSVPGKFATTSSPPGLTPLVAKVLKANSPYESSLHLMWDCPFAMVGYPTWSSSCGLTCSVHLRMRSFSRRKSQ